MAVTKEMADQWEKEAKEAGATHLIIVCDTFDYEDYPVMVMPEEDLAEKCKQFDGVNMQRIMETINLNP